MATLWIFLYIKTINLLLICDLLLLLLPHIWESACACVCLCVSVCQTNKVPHYAASVVGLQEAVKEDRGMIAL